MIIGITAGTLLATLPVQLEEARQDAYIDTYVDSVFWGEVCDAYYNSAIPIEQVNELTNQDIRQMAIDAKRIGASATSSADKAQCKSKLLWLSHDLGKFNSKSDKFSNCIRDVEAGLPAYWIKQCEALLDRQDTK